MVKKMMRTGLALLTVSSMFAMTAFAADEEKGWNENGGSFTVEGDAWAVDPVIEVELPGDLAFGINPLSLDADEDGTADAQIVTSQYLITNYSNVPVLIKTSTTLTGGDKVDILADADYETNGDLKSSSTDGNKSIWMVQLYPTSAATISDEGNTITITDVAANNKNADVKGKPLGATAAESLFLLKANTAETLDPACVSGFTFGGAVDPNATFDETDEVKVTTVFTLNTLSANQVDNDYEAKADYDTTVVEAKAATTP
jgi:hypothetical protein